MKCQKKEFIKTKQNSVSWAWEWLQELTENWHGGALWSDENVFKLECEDCCTNQ